MDLKGLRSARHQSALTQRELGELAGVSQPTIIGIELGRRLARPSTVRKLAKALGVAPAALAIAPPTDAELAHAREVVAMGHVIGGRQGSDPTKWAVDLLAAHGEAPER